jgi:hypothetical protein
MVSTMVNKHAYKLSLHDIMEKYYEMFRGKNQASKKRLFRQSHSDHDSDADG